MEKRMLKVRPLDIEAGGEYIVVLNERWAHQQGILAGDRIRIERGEKELIGIVDTSDRSIRKDEIGIFEEIEREYGFKEGQRVQIKRLEESESSTFIKEKLDGKKLNYKKIKRIIEDIVDNRLSDAEISAFAVSTYTRDFSIKEIADLTKAVVQTGGQLEWKGGPIANKHSVTHETPVMVKEDNKIRIREIGELVDRIIEDSDSRKVETGGRYSEVSDLKVPIFDRDKKISFKAVTGVFRHPTPGRVLKLTLKGNRNVKITEGHSLFVLRGGKIRSIPLNALKEGDFVVVPRKPFANSGKSYSLSLIEFLKEKQIKKDDVLIVGAAEELGEKGYKKRQDIALINDYPLSVLMGQEEAKIRQKGGKNLPTKIEVNEYLMKLLGYYVAEGFTNDQGVFLSLGEDNKEIIEDMKKCIREVFGSAPTLHKPHPSAYHICMYNRLLARIFPRLFNVGRKASEKRVPEIVFNSSRERKFEFLKAYVRGDGHEHKNYELTVATISKELYQDLCYLLSTLGISFSTSVVEGKIKEFNTPTGKRTSETRESYYIYFQANKLYERESNEAAYINFLPLEESGLDEKMLKSEELDWKTRRKAKRQKYVTYHTAKDIVSCLDGENNLELLAKGDIGFLEVKEIEEVSYDGEYVYDLCVENYNKFLGGEAPIFLHNSLGGVPGNRTTPIVVAIVASTGTKIPKTSSRAITSPAGTADTIEVLADVTFSSKELKGIVEKTNGCLAWGGAMDLAPADSKLIEVVNPLRLDPLPLTITSIMAKKKASGSTHLLLDIPFGRRSKVENEKEAKNLKGKFKRIGEKLNIKTKIVLTNGSEPIGNGIGPVLEAKDVLKVIERRNSRPMDLEKKSVNLAGKLLKLIGFEDGNEKAKEILESKKALNKFKEIIEAQNGDPTITSKDLKPARRKEMVKADKDGEVTYIDNVFISEIARRLGCPGIKESGIYIHKHVGAMVERGEKILTMYAKSKGDLVEAKEYLRQHPPFKIK